jgi:hypothetical protein
MASLFLWSSVQIIRQSLREISPASVSPQAAE